MPLPSASPRLSSLAAITTAAVLTSPALHAATYNWLAVRASGTGTGWTAGPNFQGGLGGQLPVTNQDTLIFDAGTRNAQVNNTATVGKVVIGPNFGGAIIYDGLGLANVDGSGGLTDAGIEVQAGRTETNFNSPVSFLGDVTVQNHGSARLRFGQSAGNGGISGSGTLSFTRGVSLLENTTAGHTYSGAVIVTGATLQVTSGATFNTYSSLIAGSGASLTGGGAFGSATVHSGGRVSPGGEGNLPAAPATLSFTGLLEIQATGLVTIDLKAAGTDAIDATAGDIVLGGELRLRLNSDYITPADHPLFLGLDATSGNFSTVTIRTDSDDASAITLSDDGTGVWSGNFASRGYDVVFNARSGILSVTAVPEPAAMLLSSFGLLTLLRRRR